MAQYDLRFYAEDENSIPSGWYRSNTAIKVVAVADSDTGYALSLPKVSNAERRAAYSIPSNTLIEEVIKFRKHDLTNGNDYGFQVGFHNTNIRRIQYDLNGDPLRLGQHDGSDFTVPVTGGGVLADDSWHYAYVAYNHSAPYAAFEVWPASGSRNSANLIETTELGAVTESDKVIRFFVYNNPIIYIERVYVGTDGDPPPFDFGGSSRRRSSLIWTPF